jgi:hypothetical protein
MEHALTATTPRVASRRPARGEHVVMAGSVLAIVVLIVLPLASLV